ncbi:unnamed protein product [Clavelina lepadiformis]|uniref:Endoplasmic reticulum junction formation protein lunapark n=1 Tax=Clavelina lepadiformis TaxID=159417 RepID=A0ABP0EY22_CLALP
MGTLLSRWKKSKTTVETLEDIDKDIHRLEKFRKSNQALRSRVIGNFILYSVIIYIFGCAALYLFFSPTSWVEQCLQILPTLCFPILIYLLKRFLHWWFVRKISRNELELQDLKDRRKEILENVMETETYKKAKEILEKFDPETKKKLEEERQRRENPSGPPQTPGTELRRRNLPATSPQGNLARQQPAPSGTPVGRGIVGTGSSMTTPNYPLNGTGRGQLVPVPPPLPRPLIQPNRSTLEKIVEYFVGDGPNNRYALICKNCYSHNGMALREEFEYTDFRCAYCRFFNLARKQRPNAPKLPMRVQSPMVMCIGDVVKPMDQDGGNDSTATPSTVSKASDSEHEEMDMKSSIQPKNLFGSVDDALVEQNQEAEEVDSKEADSNSTATASPN